MSKSWRGTLLDLFFPRLCVGCGARGEFICSACRRQLAPVGPSCPKCGRPQADGNTCALCWGQSSSLDTLQAPFRFKGVMRDAIHKLKYHHMTALAQPLAGLMADFLRDHPIPSDVLAPVPLHPRRLKERGYNQSALLAHELGRLAGLPVAKDSLSRVRDAGPQVRTGNADERRANVANAFSSRENAFQGMKVMLIDDVCTSGATLEACAAAARNGGAAAVAGLTLAREV